MGRAPYHCPTTRIRDAEFGAMTRNTPRCAPSPPNLVSVFMYAHVFLYQREYPDPLVIMTKKNIQYGLPRLISCRTVIITFFAAMSTWRSLHHRPVYFWLPDFPVARGHIPPNPVHNLLIYSYSVSHTGERSAHAMGCYLCSTS